MKLRVNNLTLKTAKKVLVDNVSFDLDDNQSLAIVGPSGSGKSSLLKGILGIADDDIRQSGQTIFSINQVRFGYIPQDLSLWPHLNVQETLELSYRFTRNVHKPRTIGIFDLMKNCGLTHLRRQKPSSLSGGEKQSLALARALVNEPHVLVLDEPWAHLDVVAKDSLIKLITEIKRRMRLSVIFVSHDLRETLALGERIMIMDKGSLVWLGDKNKLDATRFLPHWNPLSKSLLRPFSSF